MSNDTRQRFSVSTVSYLNARPLVSGLEVHPEITLVPDVPSRLLDNLVSGRADIALCPVIDFQRSPVPLVIVPVGGIGSDGPTFTVRIFSRQPLGRVRRIWTDIESHTSAALLETIYQTRFGYRPHLEPLSGIDGSGTYSADREALLLIGDKVVGAAPQPDDYPYQLDLGEAWKEMTGFPFVFAVWMAREGTDLGHLPRLLEEQLALNLARISSIAEADAPAAGWPAELAEHYLGRILDYHIGARERSAIETFWKLCKDLGMIAELRPWSAIRGSSDTSQDPGSP